MGSFTMKILEEGITAVPGIVAAGVHCGLKKNGDKDLALIYSKKPSVAAGVFTRNKFKAPPLLVTARHMAGPVRAVVVNSGISNACTGEQGLQDALKTAEIAADKLGIKKEEVLVASTGVIGFYLPMEQIAFGIEKAVSGLSAGGGKEAALAIMTTDTVSKESACRVEDSKVCSGFTIAGMAKGSGMICPDMATMLAFLATDVKIKKELLQKALAKAADYSFNLITVDGDTSTNDMVLLLANGVSDVEITEDSPLWETFNQALLHVCRDLAYQIVADGEGATKVIKLTVKGAPDYRTARELARTILNSSLVRTAFFGEDANWGRIITAMGYTDVEFYPERVNIFLGPVQVTASGKGLVFDELQAKQVLMQPEIPVLIDLNMGAEEVTAWGCDLSYEYVKINSAYRS
jgi:glutamate N-acetyltransferase/amino-acid N-acetyltransferase